MHEIPNGPLTLERAKELMDEVIAEKGEDFIYQLGANKGDGCFNFSLARARANGIWTGSPIPGDPRETTGCLVGSILERWGVNFEGDEMSSSAHDFSHLYAGSDVREFLGAAQGFQDNGETWGAARREAYRRVYQEYGA